MVRLRKAGEERCSMQAQGGGQDLRRLPQEHVRLMTPRQDLATAFDRFRIADAQFLDEQNGRQRCPACGHSRKYFCYTCPEVLPCFKARLPSVELPVAVDIVKHAKETSGKSTAVHAPLLSRAAALHTFPAIPDYRTQRAVLVFPGDKSIRLEECLEKFQSSKAADQQADSNNLPFDKIVLIDCTWNQVKSILLDERMIGLPRVELSAHDTLFWRYQTGKPATYLATIEALYYTLLTLHRTTSHGAATPSTARPPSFVQECSRKRNFRTNVSHGVTEERSEESVGNDSCDESKLFIGDCCHQYDNLLFFFKFMYCKIHNLYGSENLRAYK